MKKKDGTIQMMKKTAQTGNYKVIYFLTTKRQYL